MLYQNLRMAQILRNQQNPRTINTINIASYMKGMIQAPKGFTVMNGGQEEELKRKAWALWKASEQQSCKK